MLLSLGDTQTWLLLTAVDKVFQLPALSVTAVLLRFTLLDAIFTVTGALGRLVRLTQ